MLQKLKITLTITILCAGFLTCLSPAITYADKWASSSSSASVTTDPCHPENHDPPGEKLSSQDLAACENCKDSTVPGVQKCLSTNPIVRDLNKVVNFLAGAVGVITVIMMIVGGVQYSLARNKPEAVSAARKRVLNAVIALVAFMFIWAFIQWLVPGGVFG